MRVITEYPVALDSPDHLHPYGAILNNSTNSAFIDEVELHFKRTISMCDLGCAGGQLVADFKRRGHTAIGIEGSDSAITHFNWPELYGKNLFTADIGRPFTITEDEDPSPFAEPFDFDLITAWEVLEHLPPKRLEDFFLNVNIHLKLDGMFLASINTTSETSSGYEMHQSIFGIEEWRKHWEVCLHDFPYPFKTWVRNDNGFLIMLKRSPK